MLSEIEVATFTTGDRIGLGIASLSRVKYQATLVMEYYKVGLSVSRSNTGPSNRLRMQP